jgi:hypothetical protein
MLTDLSICASCTSDLVQLVEYEPAANGDWHLITWCPECETAHAGTYDQPTVDRFDLTMDAGFAALASSYEFLHELNFRLDVERFVSALAHDAILPEDFGRARTHAT